jgi:hypothetical protein
LLSQHQPAQAMSHNGPTPLDALPPIMLNNMQPHQIQGLLSLLNNHRGAGSAATNSYHHEPVITMGAPASSAVIRTAASREFDPAQSKKPESDGTSTLANNDDTNARDVAPPVNYEIAAALLATSFQRTNPAARGSRGDGLSVPPTTDSSTLADALQQSHLQGLILQHQLAAAAAASNNNPIVPRPHQETPLSRQELLQKLFQSLNDNSSSNNSNNNYNVQLLQQQQPGSTLPFHLLSSQHQHTSHSQTSSSSLMNSSRNTNNPFLLSQPTATVMDHLNISSNDNPFLWQNGVNHHSNNVLSPNTIQQETTTNTLNHDAIRLLLLTSSSAPVSNIGSLPRHLMTSSTTGHPYSATVSSNNSSMLPPYHPNNNAALNSLILQSLGLAPPPSLPPPSQMDPNMVNMLLGHIAMNNPSMLTAAMGTGSAASSFVASDHSAHNLKNLLTDHGGPTSTTTSSDVPSVNARPGRDKEACDDSSSAATCELAYVDPIPMSTDQDKIHVSKYQCLVRKQIHFFEATDADVRSTAQGRNKPIVLGQVGIQCRHCVKSSPKLRARGAVYFPSKWTGIYQAAQNMASAHFAFCSDTPESVKTQLTKLKEGKSTAGGGKKFWGESAGDLGVVEDRYGLRFKKA